MRARDFVVAAAVVAIASLAYGADPIELTLGVPVTGLSGSISSEVYYKVEVPSGQAELEIRIYGGTGDCDLFVRRSGLPTFNGYDYRPFLTGNDETVTVTDPASGNWYIMLRGGDAYSGVTLVADCQPADPIPLDNGVAKTGLSGRSGSEIVYYIDVPAGEGNLEVVTSGGHGDVDLYVKRGAIPALFDFDERSFGSGNAEIVNIENPAAGRWYIMLGGTRSYWGVTLRATYGSSGPATRLEDGVPVTGLSDSLGGESCFVIDVPNRREGISFSISGGTGDCDMYIKHGSRPTTSDYDYRPSGSGNNESISLGSPAGGDWYVLLVATPAYSGVTLLADYWGDTPEEPEAKRLTPGVPVTDIGGEAGSEQFFSLNVPSHVTKVVIKMSGGTGDADLYVRKGELPSMSEYDYRPYLPGNDEIVTITKSVAGPWFIMIRGYRSFSGITLVATFDTPSPDTVPMLLNDIPVTGLAGAAGSEKFYTVEVPEGVTKLEIALGGGVGDADLYVRSGVKPTVSEWDYRPYLHGNEETVAIDNPKAGTWFIMIRAYLAYEGATLKAAWSPVTEQIKVLESCVPVAGLSGAQDSEVFFKIDIPAAQELLRIEISGGTGDADLYVKKGEKPTTRSWDYHPNVHGNEEFVEASNPAATTWYIMLRGYQAYAGVTLQACCKEKKKDCDECIIVIP